MTESNTQAVRTEGVWKIFQQEAEEVQAVRDVSLTIERGEFTVLAGPSGSGKTTLLNLIGGLTRPTRGRVWVAGQEVSEMSNQDLAQLRLEQVGFVFQAYNLLPVLTALENAEFPMLLQGVAGEERAARISELFERTGMSGLEDRRPGKLSGGQQQRVAVVRAVASQPRARPRRRADREPRFGRERRAPRGHARAESRSRRHLCLRHALHARHELGRAGWVQMVDGRIDFRPDPRVTTPRTSPYGPERSSSAATAAQRRAGACTVASWL